MGKVIVVTSGKGGVGKTTTTANLGVALAAQGLRVCLLDADIGLRNLDVVMGLENRIVYDVVDVVEGFCTLRQALIKDKRFEGLCLLPAAQTKEKSAVSPEDMRALTDEIRRDFDYALIDCPAGIEQGFRMAVAGAEEAIVVATPDVTSVRDADRVIGLLEAEGLRLPRLILNRMRPAMVRHGDMMALADVLDVLAIELVGVIPEDDMVLVATNRGEPAVLTATSRAGRAYRRVAKRLMGHPVPIRELEEEGSLVGRLRRLIGFGES